MRVSVDVGYSTVKAVSEIGERVCFPSVVGQVKDDPVNGIFNDTAGYKIAVRSGNDVVEKLVGEAALHSISATSTLAREKPKDIHDLFILAASYLVGAGTPSPANNNNIALAVGLPLAYYKTQRSKLQKQLECLAGNVQVGDGIEKYISFQKVEVYPQGVGILLMIPELPTTGYIGIINIGSYTSDYLMFEIYNGDPTPIPEACGSIEIGTHYVQADLRAAFQSITGAPLAHFMVQKTMQTENQKIRFQGKDVDLSDACKNSCQNTARQIIEQIRSAWSGRAEYLSLCAFAGGGAELFRPYISNSFPGSLIVSDPVFADAEGFLKMMSDS
ncbi:MAG: ParM/StbA family protein [Syntrophomonadaceae bacterium]|nr:ParM/StbA family protein [Syntrophomonadaceae bacterium]MDD4550026.1 ParM/StbA family protein [Syntrophomonadaceae bacterium]